MASLKCIQRLRVYATVERQPLSALTSSTANEAISIAFAPLPTCRQSEHFHCEGSVRLNKQLVIPFIREVIPFIRSYVTPFIRDSVQPFIRVSVHP